MHHDFTVDQFGKFERSNKETYGFKLRKCPKATDVN